MTRIANGTGRVQNLLRGDGSRHVRNCNCGGFWKVSQSPRHTPSCEARTLRRLFPNGTKDLVKVS